MGGAGYNDNAAGPTGALDTARYPDVARQLVKQYPNMSRVAITLRLGRPSLLRTLSVSHRKSVSYGELVKVALLEVALPQRAYAQALEPQPAVLYGRAGRLTARNPRFLARAGESYSATHNNWGAVCHAPLCIFQHLVGEGIHRYAVSLSSLECQVSKLVNRNTCPRLTTVSKLVNSDACPRPTTVSALVNSDACSRPTASNFLCLRTSLFFFKWRVV
jgi:hypothetical protein